jgi:hypothetical protein
MQGRRQRGLILCCSFACLLPFAAKGAGQGDGKSSGKSEGRAKEDAAATSLEGVEVGMSLQQVVETIGRIPDSKRVGDAAKPPKGVYVRPQLEPDGILFWRLKDESILEVGIRKEHALYVGIQYSKNRRASDFGLVNFGTIDERREEERKWGAELQPPLGAFRHRQLSNKDSKLNRVAWDRREKHEAGFSLEIVFLSPTFGESRSYGRQVATRRISVMNEEQKKFDEWVEAKASK